MASQVSVFDGDALTHETIIPGNTPTGIGSGVYAISRLFYNTSGSDLLTNGSMASGDPPSSWTASGTATAASETANRTNSGGTTCLKLTAGAATDYVYQDITTVAGTRYRLRFYYKNTAGDLAQVRVTTDPSGTEANETLYDSHGNQKSSSGVVDLESSTSFSAAQDLFFTATGTTTRIYLRAKANTDVVYFDDVSVMAVSAAAGTRDGYKGKYEDAYARAAMISCESYAARFTLNGDSPTHSTAPEPNVGIQLNPGYTYVITGINNIKNFRVVDDVSGSACKVRVVCFF